MSLSGLLPGCSRLCAHDDTYWDQHMSVTNIGKMCFVLMVNMTALVYKIAFLLFAMILLPALTIRPLALIHISLFSMGADGNKSSMTSSPKHEFAPSFDVWYSDGSVVLVAEKTAFRVHGTILAANSEIFKDILALAGLSC